VTHVAGLLIPVGFDALLDIHHVKSLT